MITKTFTAFKVDIPSDYVMKHDRNYFKFYNFIEMGGIVKFEINKLGETAKKSFQFKVKTSEIVAFRNHFARGQQYRYQCHAYIFPVYPHIIATF